MPQQSIFLEKWKDDVTKALKLQYGKSLSKKKLDHYLDDIIAKRMKVPKVNIVNNYVGIVAKSDVLALIDLIEKNQLIIGGGGVLYQQHHLKTNPLIKYILHVMQQRKFHKNERKKYAEDTYEWLMEDIAQLNYKIIINSLYGVQGYPRFVLYNRFIAEAVTNQGRQIICSAAEAFENFICDTVNFSTAGEAMTYISNIYNEYKEFYKDKLDVSVFRDMHLRDKVFERLIQKCKFSYDETFKMQLLDIVTRADDVFLTLLYYKNNLIAFNQHSFIKDKYRYIISEVDQFNQPNISLLDAYPKAKKFAQDIWEFYRVFVLYDYPIYDRVRKTMYIDKKSVLYIDTDSNFIGLNPFISYIKDDVLNGQFPKDEQTIDFIGANLFTYYLGFVVDASMQTLCKSMNVTEEYAKKLGMKNEFYFRKILFTDKKKRYIMDALLQEGELLGGGLGKPEAKGFDFKKSTVKPFVKDYYTNIYLNDILRQEEVHVEIIFAKMLVLKSDIEESMRKGESKYFKQAQVQLPEHYKKPYSMQGITSVMLWNALCPDYAMELPTDVDIIPIKSMTQPKPRRNKGEDEDSYRVRIRTDLTVNMSKQMQAFADQYPEAFAKVEDAIYRNPNPQIRYMSINYIAKPKNSEVPLPDWFGDLINTTKVVDDTLALFLPIMQSLGSKVLKTTSTSSHMSNIVDL